MKWNWIRASAIAVVVVTALAQRVHAQDTNKWAAGYPKKGMMAGSVLVKGTATPAIGYALTGSGVITWYKKGSGTLNQQALTVNQMTGVWGESAVLGLTVGTTYVFQAQAGQKKGMDVNTIITDPEEITP